MQPLSVDTWGTEEREAILRVLDSGQYTMGKTVQEYERAYADYIGTEYCVAVNSGSSANLLMVAALTLSMAMPPYEKPAVVVPAVGWSTSYSPFQQYGWRLTFVDIDPETLNYDLAHLRLTTDQTKPQCILAINLLGNPNEFEGFPPGIPILEDNCEAMGAEYYGRKTGSIGLMSSHSTYFSHHICTMEGGMITTDDQRLYHLLLSLRSHGWTRHLPEKNALGARVDKFHFIVPGYNVRPTEIQAAVGLEQLKKLPSFVEQRRENASRLPWKTQKEIGKSSWFGFAIFDEDRAEVARRFETRPVVSGNFLRHPTIRYYDYWPKVASAFSGAEYIDENALMIGNSHKRIEWRL